MNRRETDHATPPDLKIRPDTIVRGIVLAVALINQAAAAFGWVLLDLNDEAIHSTVFMAYELLSILFTMVISIIAYLKDNPLSKLSIFGHQIMAAHKDGTIPIEICEDCLDEHEHLKEGV